MYDYLNNLHIHFSEILKTNGTKEVGICTPNEFVEIIPILFQQESNLNCFLLEDKIIYPKISNLSHLSILLSILGIQVSESLEPEINDLSILFNKAMIQINSLKIKITKNEFNIQFNSIFSDTLKSFLKIGIYLSTTYNISSFIADKIKNDEYESNHFSSLNDTFSYFNSLI